MSKTRQPAAARTERCEAMSVPSRAARRSARPVDLERELAVVFDEAELLKSGFRVARAYEAVLITKRSCTMAPTQPRHDDIIIRRRFGEHSSTHMVKQIYAVTYPGHTDHGAERENYGEAEQAALGLAREQGRSVWYEESPQSGRRTLVKSFRASD
jgi:hypothetical protein